jgi:hypothetical protein
MIWNEVFSVTKNDVEYPTLAQYIATSRLRQSGFKLVGLCERG